MLRIREQLGRAMESECEVAGANSSLIRFHAPLYLTVTLSEYSHVVH